jgi:hypothetical protein
MVVGYIGVDIGKAILSDLDKQGVFDFVGRDGVDADRVGRAAVREMRSISDLVFKAAGLNPKFHRENFIKIIDEIMKGL